MTPAHDLFANAWATPYALNPGSPFAYWDGTAWTDGGVPNVPGAETVNWRGISKGSPCDVWAVGSYHDGTTHHTLVARLDPSGSTVTAVGDRATPTIARLSCHPNPFNPTTTLFYAPVVDGPVSLVVYDLKGRLVRTLVNETTTRGEQHVEWDGRDEAGRALSSGVYFAVFDATGVREMQKLSLVK